MRQSETNIDISPDIGICDNALEKNQQWLVYDQQREVYVQSVVARTLDLEQQLTQAKQQQTNTETTAEASTSSPSAEKDSEQKSHFEELVLKLQRELESQKDQTAKTKRELNVEKEEALKAQAELRRQKEQVCRGQEEMSALQRRYEDKCSELSAFLGKYVAKSKELDEAGVQLQAERVGNRHAANEERKVSERADRMRAELDSVERKLEEERKRSAGLLMQINMLQKSLLSQNEDGKRIAALEQQVQLSAKDFENEKLDRQSLQQQLHKVLKELRKARDQIAKLESARQTCARFSEPSSYEKLDFERLTVDGHHGPASPSKVIGLLDESFLECPKCRAPYPTSRHRELLAHIDDCFA
ncbi:centrosomal protein of 55 kDa [Nematolebias whitei]|uniref:centrosomal protein of 55 kDa n=1 Tax=Nematolebias whitei TaxID=451745 RepID=UPI001896D220|nr:centrosomal protein of 55 kDa [Nematolebias whitei]